MVQNQVMMQLEMFRKQLEHEGIRCTYSMVETSRTVHVFFAAKGDYDEAEYTYSIPIPETREELEIALFALEGLIRSQTRKRPEPETGFATHRVRIIMCDGGDLENGEDWYEFEVMTKDSVSANDVGIAFSKDQAKLEAPGNFWYHKYGKTPDTLAEYVCRRRGWHWRRMEHDVTIYM